MSWILQQVDKTFVDRGRSEVILHGEHRDYLFLKLEMRFLKLSSDARRVNVKSPGDLEDPKPFIVTQQQDEPLPIRETLARQLETLLKNALVLAGAKSGFNPCDCRNIGDV